MLKAILIFFIFLHGLLHLIGFYRSFSKNGVIRLKGYMPKSHGLLWLICTALFLLTGFAIIFNVRGWMYFVIAALLISQVLILLSWKEARYGTFLNIAILVLSTLYLNNLLN